MNQDIREIIAAVLGELVSAMSPSKATGESLGFTNDVNVGGSTYVFVNRGQGSGCWYTIEGEGRDSRTRYMPQGLRGYVTGLRLAMQRSEKYGDAEKLDIIVQADKTYIVRTGLESVFARGLISQLLEAKPGELTLVAEPSRDDEKIVFSSVIQDGKRLTPKWLERDTNLIPYIQKAAASLGATFTDNRTDEEKPNSAATKPAPIKADDNDQPSRALAWLNKALTTAKITNENDQLTVLRNVLTMPGLTWNKIGLAEIKILRTKLTRDGALDLSPLEAAYSKLRPAREEEFGEDAALDWDDDNYPL